MAGDLIIPRCEVYWGDVNLSFYEDAKNWPGSDGPQPLVYDVKVNLQESGQTPSGSMKWNPSGLAFAAYEKLLTENYDKVITVRFYYTTGRSISFGFVWAGQTESYGRDMSLEVKLSSELDGLIMSNIRSVAQANDDKGISMKSAVSELEKFYGIDGFKLIKYYGDVSKELDKVTVKSNYSEGSNFASAIENIAEQNGNLVFLHNIINSGDAGSTGTGIVLFPPYTWEGSTYSKGELKPNKNASPSLASLEPTAQNPRPDVRYGYFLGPAIIDTITKTSEWAPPQKTQTYTINTQPKVQPRAGNTAQPSPTNQQAGQATTRQRSRRTGGAAGTSGSAARPGMRLEKNEEGEQKKLVIQEERTAKLSASLFMCPALTGIKPCDIVFIPNYSGTYIEDWIVTSVEYEQTDGGVNLNIQAARKFGLGDPMHQVNADIWLKQANSKDIGLVGPSATIEKWIEYAWGGV